MPELPEVEVTRLMLNRSIKGKTVNAVRIFETKLRWPVPEALTRLLPGFSVIRITRRGKYLLVEFKIGVLLIHLGMSGALLMYSVLQARKKHEHIEIEFDNTVLRFCDPRKFGSFLWLENASMKHWLLKDLGPEPFSLQLFTASYLYQLTRTRRCSIKSLIMNSKVVVGVGNIYASEALFLAKINPNTQCYTLSQEHYERLIIAIKRVLLASIRQGGTTLRDFKTGDGNVGYFKLALKVYGRAQKPCVCCGALLKAKKIVGRSTVFCQRCQID